MKLTQAVKVSGLSEKHIGREFVGLGTLAVVALTAVGYHLKTESGEWFHVSGDLRLDYWRTEVEINGPRNRARAQFGRKP